MSMTVVVMVYVLDAWQSPPITSYFHQPHEMSSFLSLLVHTSPPTSFFCVCVSLFICRSLHLPLVYLIPTPCAPVEITHVSSAVGVQPTSRGKHGVL